MARTLRELREELLDRLNFGSQATSDTATVRLANSFLRNAQTQLYWHYDFSDLLMIWKIDMSLGVAQYAWPTSEENPTVVGVSNELEPRRIINVSLQDGTFRSPPLREGILPTFYNQTSGGRPTHYARRAKVEFWPVPDSSSYDIYIEGYCKLRPFESDTDTTTVDEELVFMLALANGKAHYRQPDAEIYANEMNAMMKRLRGADHGGRRYIPGMNDDHTAMPMPRRVDGP